MRLCPSRSAPRTIPPADSKNPPGAGRSERSPADCPAGSAHPQASGSSQPAGSRQSAGPPGSRTAPAAACGSLGPPGRICPARSRGWRTRTAFFRLPPAPRQSTGAESADCGGYALPGGYAGSGHPRYGFPPPGEIPEPHAPGRSSGSRIPGVPAAACGRQSAGARQDPPPDNRTAPLRKPAGPAPPSEPTACAGPPPRSGHPHPATEYSLLRPD
ncbi:hypothetical protein D3C75_825380 [compost metagenome]